MALPIPSRSSGYTLGSPAADVAIEAFVDIQCPHSRAAWPTLLQLIDHYSKKSVSVTVHLLTLSNHRQSWDLSLGLFALAGDEAKKFFAFATFLYDRQERFNNKAFLNKTHSDLIELVTGFAVEHGEVERETFLRKMQSSEVYTDARTPIRYSSTRAVWGTPTFFVNNADDVPVNHESTLQDWAALIDPLL